MRHSLHEGATKWNDITGLCASVLATFGGIGWSHKINTGQLAFLPESIYLYAMSNAKYIRKHRETKTAAGLKRLEVWARPEDHERIKRYVKKLVPKK